MCVCVSGVRQEEEQKQCLELGKEAGLDIGRVTKAVVETIRSSGQVSSGVPQFLGCYTLLGRGGWRQAIGAGSRCQ